ncbi:MAG: hypothetical protein K0R73_1329 [Candidatus Midichloriaceae bacterium]|jgi:uncharacterized protein involved in outer membrane biogenesis|nr:hypothetical protein [Candidatus Midichloriaceae bacterium]
MKKFILMFIALLIAVVIAVYIYFDAVIKYSIETYGSRAINSQISVGAVSISLKEGLVLIKRVQIANPSGFKETNVFELNDIKVSLDIKSIFSKLIKVNYIHINGPTIIYELGPLGDNLIAFKTKVHSNPNASQSSSSDPEQVKKIIISDFRIINAVATVSLAQLAQKSIKIPDIQISEIGQSQGGITVSEASKQITDEVIKVVIASNTQKLLEKVDSLMNKDEITNQTKGLLKKLF